MAGASGSGVLVAWAGIVLATCVWSQPIHGSPSIVLSPEAIVSVPGPLVYQGAYDIDASPRVAWSPISTTLVWDLHFGVRRSGWSMCANDDSIWTRADIFEREDVTLGREVIRGGTGVCANESGQFIAVCEYSRRMIDDQPSFNVGLYESVMDSGRIEWRGPTFPMPFLPNRVSASVSVNIDQLTVACDAGDMFIAFTHRLTSLAIGTNSASICFVSRLEGEWTALQTLAGPTSEAARIVVGTDGGVMVIWHDMGTGQVVGKRTTDGGLTFSEPIVIGEMLANYSWPPRYLENDPRQNRLYCDGELAPHEPSVAVDRSEGPRRGWMYAVWAEAFLGTAEPVTTAIQEREPNDTYAQATRLESGQDGVGTGVGADFGDNDLDYFYFEGRAGETFRVTGEATGTSPSGPMAFCGQDICLTGGDPFGPDYIGPVGTGSFNDGPIINPPLLVTLPVDGRYFFAGAFAQARERVGYRIRAQRMTPVAGSVARDHRDVVMVVSRDGGLTWSSKRLVNDDPPRFDNCMPEVVVDGLGRAHVAWYDRRDDGEGINYHVYWTWSTDGGESFVPSMALSATQTDIARSHVMQLGDHLGLCGTDEGIIGAWTFATADGLYNENKHQVRSRRVSVLTAAAVVGLQATTGIERVDLTWQVTEAEVLRRFRIGRRSVGGGGEFDSIGVVGRASDPASTTYTFQDTAVTGAVEYEYRVDLVLANGSLRLSEPIMARVPETPVTLGLRLVSAGGGETGPARFELVSPVTDQAQVRVYDVQGSPVMIRDQVLLDRGTNIFSWDRKTDGGSRPSGGVYFLEVRVAGYRATLKFVLSEK